MHHDYDQPSDPRPTTHPLVHLTLAVLTIVCLLGVAAHTGAAIVEAVS